MFEKWKQIDPIVLVQVYQQTEFGKFEDAKKTWHFQPYLNLT